MKILILAHALRAGGGREVCKNLLEKIAVQHGGWHVTIILPDQPQYREKQFEKQYDTVLYYNDRYGYMGRLYFDWVVLNRVMHKFKPDLVWSMGGLGLINPPCCQVVSIHNPYVVYDSSHTGLMNLKDSMRLFFLVRHFNKQLSKTHLIFCQTTTMKKRIKDVYRYQKSIVVTGKSFASYSAERNYDPPVKLKPYQTKFKLFCLTRYYPHKGLETLVDLMEHYRDLLDDVIIVITIEACQHRNALRLLRRIKQLELEDCIVNVGPLAQEELAGFYKTCDCLIMPTRLESFSGAYLEAMHFGLPILTSDLDFARETCGDAALYFDPWDISSIKDCILRIKNESELRKEMVNRGKMNLKHAHSRTWEDIAKIIIENLEDLLLKYKR